MLCNLVLLLKILILILILLKVESSSYMKTWSNRLGSILTPVSTGVWAAERPFIWNSIDVGGRSVICRMNDGSLLIHSPVNYTNELGNALESLGGNVGYIISPNYEHLKYASQWNKQYPNAKMIACPGLPEKMNDINWSIELNHNLPDNLIDSIDSIWFDCESVLGKPFFNEIIFYHKKSKTCIMTDIWWNYPSNELPNYFGQYETGQIHECSKVPISDKFFPSINVPSGTLAWKFGMDKIYWPFYRNIMVGNNIKKKNNYMKAVEKLLSWDVETLAPCHGDLVRGKKLINEILTKHFL